LSFEGIIITGRDLTCVLCEARGVRGSKWGSDPLGGGRLEHHGTEQDAGSITQLTRDGLQTTCHWQNGASESTQTVSL